MAFPLFVDLTELSKMDRDMIESELFQRYDLTKAFLIYLGMIPSPSQSLLFQSSALIQNDRFLLYHTVLVDFFLSSFSRLPY